MSFKNESDIIAYSCGSCGYALNLSSSDRDTAGIGSKYGRDIRKGVVTFNTVDASRFSQIGELKLRPYFSSKHSWGLLRRRTMLYCRKCRNFIGFAYEESSSPVASDSASNSSSTDGGGKKYNIKITALQPAAAGGD